MINHSMAADPQGQPKIRVLLAYRHTLILKGLELVFAMKPEFEVLGGFADGQMIPSAIESSPPDILLLDLEMPGVEDLHLVRVLRDQGLKVRIVLLASELTDKIALEAIRLDVQGIFPKNQSPELLFTCIQQVHAGQRWVERQVAGQLLGQMAWNDTGTATANGLEPLTPRERELVRQVATGLSNRDIARQLNITEGTVKFHLHRIYAKLNLKNRVELANHAREQQPT